MHVNVVVLDKLGLDELPAHRLLGVGPLGLDFDRIQWLLARGGHPLFEEGRGELELRFHQLVAGEVKEVLLGVAQVDLGQFFFDFGAKSGLVGHGTLSEKLVKKLGVQRGGLNVVDLLELESEVTGRQRVLFGIESEYLVDVKVLFEVAHVDDQTVSFGEGLEVLFERTSAHRVEAEATVLVCGTFDRLTLLGDDVKVAVEQVVVAGGLHLAHGAIALAKVFDFFVQVLFIGFEDVERNLHLVAHLKLDLRSDSEVKFKAVAVGAKVQVTSYGQRLTQNVNFLALEVGVQLVLKALVDFVSRDGLLVLLANQRHGRHSGAKPRNPRFFAVVGKLLLNGFCVFAAFDSQSEARVQIRVDGPVCVHGQIVFEKGVQR